MVFLYHVFSVSLIIFEIDLNKDKKVYMNKKDFNNERWADEKEAASHLKVKPSTLRRRRSLLGKDTNEVWHKNHGKILYDLWATDKRISNK